MGCIVTWCCYGVLWVALDGVAGFQGGEKRLRISSGSVTRSFSNA